jgi:hypothetical protein
MCGRQPTMKLMLHCDRCTKNPERCKNSTDQEARRTSDGNVRPRLDWGRIRRRDRAANRRFSRRVFAHKSECWNIDPAPMMTPLRTPRLAPQPPLQSASAHLRRRFLPSHRQGPPRQSVDRSVLLPMSPLRTGVSRSSPSISPIVSSAQHLAGIRAVPLPGSQAHP